MKYRRVDSDEPSSDEYGAAPKKRVPKRRRTLTKSEPQCDVFSLEPLLQLAGGENDVERGMFEDFMNPELLSDFLAARHEYLERLFEVDSLGQRIRPLTLSERSALLQVLQTKVDAEQGDSIDRLLLRKLKLDKYRVEHGIRIPNLSSKIALTLPNPTEFRATVPPDPSVLAALNAIGSTPYSSSLAVRSSGPIPYDKPNVLLRDWEARPQWIDLMEDIREHHVLLHPDEVWEEEMPAPVDYQTLRLEHMNQVHDLLSRVFWPGIDVHDVLDFSPEKCTVVAMHKKLVVGVAFFSSPEELYITYLAVRTGWESSQIATKMLYTLLTRNPSRDVLLHVSANNPAMLLYNRFGFKAEEFIVGFYEDYLDRQSRESKNAFRLRLRR